MKVEKIKSRIVFTDEERGHIEYDLATGTFLKMNKKGELRTVKSVNAYFVNMKANQIIASIEDINYRRFFQWCYNRLDYSVTNMGTILNHVRGYSKTSMEQYFAMGLTPSDYLSCPPSVYPKDILRFFRENDIKIGRPIENLFNSQAIEERKKLFVDSVRYAVKENYDDRACKKLIFMLERINSNYGDGFKYRDLVMRYNYDYRRLLNYIMVDMPTLEAIDSVGEVLDNLYDYTKMSNDLTGGRYEKYPKYLKTSHDIVVKTHRAFKKEIDEAKFVKMIDESLEYKDSEFSIIIPRKPDEVKQEGIAQSNCVGSYVDRIVDGKTKVAFMRKTHSITDSYITLEITPNNVICQAKRKYNTQIGEDDRKFLEKYAKAKKLKIKDGRL